MRRRRYDPDNDKFVVDEIEEDVIDYENFNYDLIQTKLSGVNAEADLYMKVMYGFDTVPWKY